MLERPSTFDLLFVYGTLLPDGQGAMGEPERHLLKAHCDHWIEATTVGSLVDLGGYPGLISGHDTINGIVYALHDAEPLFSRLDAYEGVTGGAQDEYRRVRQAVRLVDKTAVDAWIYLYRGQNDHVRRISTGRWDNA
jgi:gamma-glutamylcyclotransferase (GGCT)/AIG2-like uncharacterized protein YtfP